MVLEQQVRGAARALLAVDERAHEASKRMADALPEGPLHAFSKLGDQPQQRVIAGAILAGGLLSGNVRLTRAGARMILAHEAATAVKDQVKDRLDRKRPRSARTRSEKKLRKGDSSSKEMTSFPSGHSAGAMASARAFSREFPEYAPAAMGAAAAVAGAQIPRRAHYPTDVIAGFALGLITEAVVDKMFRALWREPGRA